MIKIKNKNNMCDIISLLNVCMLCDTKKHLLIQSVLKTGRYLTEVYVSTL